MGSQEFCNALERKDVASISTPLLYHPNLPLDIRDVFICHGHIY